MSERKSQFTNSKEITDEVFEDLDFRGNDLSDRLIESCVFINCNFAGNSFQRSTLVDCKFTNCDMSNVNLKNSIWRDVAFIDSKIIGVDWSDTELTENLDFDNCQQPS